MATNQEVKQAAATEVAAKEVVNEAPAKKVISSADRYRMIQESAYYIAEKNHFQGDAQQCWSEAEAKIDAEFITE